VAQPPPSPRVGQVVALEFLALVALVASETALPLRVAIWCLAGFGALFVVTFYQGRWAYSWAVVGARFRRTRHLSPAAYLGNHRVEGFTDRAGARHGIVVDDDAWIVILAIEPLAPAVASPFVSQGTLSVADFLQVPTPSDVVLSGVQLLMAGTSVPWVGLDQRAPLVTSYQQVAQGRSLALSRTWLVLRLDPSQNQAAVAARGGGTVGIHRCLASSAARVKAAHAGRLSLRVLNPDEARSVLENALGHPKPEVTTWQGLTTKPSEPAAQLGLELSDLHQLSDEFVQDVLRVATEEVLLSLTWSGSAEESTAVRATVRLCGKQAELAAQEVVVLAQARGITALSTNGEHLAALAETLPLARTDRQLRGKSATGRPMTAGVNLPAHEGGLIIGRSADDSQLQLRVFGERAVQVTAWVDVALLTVICYRAIAMGVKVRVLTSNSSRWLPLQRLIPPSSPLLEVSRTVEHWTATNETELSLVVMDDDLGSAQVAAVALTPRRCVIRRVQSAGTQELLSGRSADLVLVHRAAGVDVVALASALHMGTTFGNQLDIMSEEEMAVIERGNLALANLALTDQETQLILAMTATLATNTSHPRVEV
jgi:type VII secretion protein EccE